MELLAYWRVVRKRLGLLIVLMLIGAGSAFYYTHQQPPQYRTVTTLFLNPAAPSPLLPFTVDTRDRTQALANSYTEFLRTRSFGALISTQSGISITEDQLQRWISTEYVAGTQFFRIVAIHADPQVAQKLANSAAEVLIAENQTRQRAQQAQAQQGSVGQPKIEDLQASLQAELDYYNEQIKSLQTQISDLQSTSSNQNDARIASLRQALLDTQSLRVQVMTSMAQTEATLKASAAGATSVDTAVVVDAAQLPTQSLPRRAIEYALLAAVLALMLGVGVAFLLEYVDYTVKSPETLDTIYGHPTQGVIATVARRAHEQPLVALNHPLSPPAEAFRALRTGLQVAGLDEPLRSLMITSAVPGEGKSFVAANLAVSLAQNGMRVILVDADLRRPTLHRIFTRHRDRGLSDLVVDQDAIVTDYLQNTEVKTLSLLTCGTLPRNPAELLGSRRMAQVMTLLQEHADLVIYDTPPAATVTDAVVLAPQIDGVMQVVRAGVTRINLMLRCKTVLERVNARIIGPVLNQVQQNELGYYSHYYYGYYANAPRKGLKKWFGGKQPRPDVAPIDATPDTAR